MNSNLIQLLIVEDNPGDAFIIQEMLKQIQVPKINFTHVERLDDALQTLNHEPTDVVLLDLSLPDSLGLETLRSLQDHWSCLPIVILTITDDEEMAIQAMQEGAQDYLAKGQVSKESLIRSIRYAIERKRIQLELKQHTVELEVANQTLNQRTAQLELANQELETFSYTVSHDLINPLTTIMGNASFLRFQYSEQLDKQVQKCIAKIENAAQHMDQLIQDLLQLSQMSRTDLQIDSVDLSFLVQEILRSIRQRQPARKVETGISPNLFAKGDPNLLSIALTNLLENAWKYTRKREKTCIEFGAVPPESSQIISPKPLPPNQQVYFIRDNGAGFDMQRVGQLFMPFQRLHADQDFEGTGIGLATVQRIIQRHGGEIWAEAVVDQGATFYFTLPTP
ncbi:MAG: response regulator [Cyanobacteria bacterium P01_D01_bin.44]